MGKISGYQKYGKRIIDLCLVFLLLPACFPLMAIIILIQFCLYRKVFFIQHRQGKGGENFAMYKFRTMRAFRQGEDTSTHDLKRLTKFGKWLRSSSLDEIPQLLNIVKGDMSFVGPRPLLTHYDQYYTDFHKQRFLVFPGITGLAQIKGRNNRTWTARLEDDVAYVHHISFALDISIMLKTLQMIFRKHDVNKNEEVTMTEFSGYSS